jgi:ADP-ribose pyrophosphatase YjhB (NUDIX family)
MPIPDFVLALRDKIGTHPLWLSGVTAVVLRGERVLLVRRADTGEWAPVSGIVDPGEQPADTAVREVLEEADVHAAPERLALVHVSEPVVYPNGDRAQYLDLVFRMRWTAGDPHPADGENLEAAWFDLDRLPPLSGELATRVEAALADEQAARFLVSEPTTPAPATD